MCPRIWAVLSQLFHSSFLFCQKILYWKLVKFSLFRKLVKQAIHLNFPYITHNFLVLLCKHAVSEVSFQISSWTHLWIPSNLIQWCKSCHPNHRLSLQKNICTYISQVQYRMYCNGNTAMNLNSSENSV